MPLKNPVKDARGIRDILKHRYLIDEVIELFKEDDNKANIIKTFAELKDKVSQDDSVLVFYAGHGHLNKNTETGFWIPVNGGTDIYEQSNWLPNTQIRGLISQIQSDHILLISDSCFAGDNLNTTRSISLKSIASILKMPMPGFPGRF